MQALQSMAKAQIIRARNELDLWKWMQLSLMRARVVCHCWVQLTWTCVGPKLGSLQLIVTVINDRIKAAQLARATHSQAVGRHFGGLAVAIFCAICLALAAAAPPSGCRSLNAISNAIDVTAVSRCGPQPATALLWPCVLCCVIFSLFDYGNDYVVGVVVACFSASASASASLWLA